MSETDGPFKVPEKKREEGRYFWLKLPTDFFNDKVMKKLRRYPGGAENLVVALKILLLGVSGDNRIYYDGVEDSFSEEIALSIDERPESVEAVIGYLMQCGWLARESDDTIFSSKSEEMTGSISARTERWRRQQEREKAAKIAAPLPDDCRALPDHYHREEKRREEKKRAEKEEMQEEEDLTALCPMAFAEGKPRVNPTLSEVRQKAERSGFYALSPEDFFDRFSSTEWVVDGKEITDWGCLYLTLEGIARRDETEGAV